MDFKHLKFFTKELLKHSDNVIWVELDNILLQVLTANLGHILAVPSAEAGLEHFRWESEMIQCGNRKSEMIQSGNTKKWKA